MSILKSVNVKQTCRGGTVGLLPMRRPGHLLHTRQLSALDDSDGDSRRVCDDSEAATLFSLHSIFTTSNSINQSKYYHTEPWVASESQAKSPSEERTQTQKWQLSNISP